MSIKDLVGKRVSRKVKFMNEDVTISKLSVAEVMAIQEQAKSTKENEEDTMSLLRLIVKSSVEGGNELEDKDFESFPMDELAKLSNEIMKFSGISDEKGEKGK